MSKTFSLNCSQVRRQKEIRDLMKKKREKAVLVDRISRSLHLNNHFLAKIAPKS